MLAPRRKVAIEDGLLESLERAKAEYEAAKMEFATERLLYVKFGPVRYVSFEHAAKRFTAAFSEYGRALFVFNRFILEGKLVDQHDPRLESFLSALIHHAH